MKTPSLSIGLASKPALLVSLVAFLFSFTLAQAKVKFSKKDKEAIERLAEQDVKVTEDGALTAKDVDWSEVKMADLKLIAKKLYSLDFSGPATAPKKWDFLLDFKKVQKLILRNCDLKDDDLKVLPKLKALTLVRVDGNSELTSASFKSIAQCRQLRQLLAISCDKIDDKAIAELEKLKELQSIVVSGTAITDECVSSLLKIKKLSFFRAESTGFSAQAETKLKAEKKGVRVMR